MFFCVFRGLNSYAILIEVSQEFMKLLISLLLILGWVMLQGQEIRAQADVSRRQAKLYQKLTQYPLSSERDVQSNRNQRFRNYYQEIAQIHQQKFQQQRQEQVSSTLTRQAEDQYWNQKDESQIQESLQGSIQFSKAVYEQQKYETWLRKRAHQ